MFTVGSLNGTKACVPAVIEYGTRRVRILGATRHPVLHWIAQQARHLLQDLDDAGMKVKFILHVWDASFMAAFGAVFQTIGARAFLSAAQAPEMNSIRERWVASGRRELPDRILSWNQHHLMTFLKRAPGRAAP